MSKGIVLLINDLFGIDAEARAQNLDLAARDQLRQQQARPLLERIRQQIEAAREQALPASKLGGAVAYTLGLWGRLKRFLDYPELELSTNLAENSMRGVALGRKNWIHIGSPQAGPKVAAILSVVETCRRLDISAREYLAAVLPGLADVSIQKLAASRPRPGLRGTRSLSRLATNSPADGLTFTIKILVDGISRSRGPAPEGIDKSGESLRVCELGNRTG